MNTYQVDIFRYLIDQIQSTEKSSPSSVGPFYYENDRLVLNPNYSFHMYISQSPCNLTCLYIYLWNINYLIGGDASMSALAEIQSAESMEAFETGKKRKRTIVDDYPFLIDNIYANKKEKLSNSTTAQFQRGRFRYDQLGILRTKPGT